ncbi:hypothetical protein [Buchnera aphidicola]|uniref:hypothetical protein n=1 Tax=Buchnera aphidicola TaxID=9 RepID=UPI00130D6590
MPNYKILGNVGSFFKNPIVTIHRFQNIQKNFSILPYYKLDNYKIKLSAGWLIRQCGLAGYSIGGAKTYFENPIIIVNNNCANINNILNLSKKIFYTIKKKFNISIKLEVTLIGKKNPINFIDIITNNNF